MPNFIPTFAVAICGLISASLTQEPAPPTAGLYTYESAAVTDAADLYVRIEEIRLELEILRAFVGRPQNTQKELEISGVEPRGVLFIAFAILRKADRLICEQTRKPPKVDSSPLPANITLNHVATVAADFSYD